MPFIETKPVEHIKIEFAVKPFEERQTIVHCSHWSLIGSLLRATPEMYLVDKISGKKYNLLLAIDIAFFPEWTPVNETGYYHFTLIFEGLDEDCIMFDLVEESGDPMVFSALNILRNKTDVYNTVV